MKNYFKLFLILFGILGIVSSSQAAVSTEIINNVDFPRNIGYFLCFNLSGRSSCMPMTATLPANGTLTTVTTHDGYNIVAIEFAYVEFSGHITSMGGCKVTHNNQSILLGRTNCTVKRDL